MAKRCKAGCAEFRRLMKRYPGYTLESTGRGGHMFLYGSDGRAVRLPDGRRLTIISSPSNETAAAKELTRKLAALGITPTVKEAS